jgi:two-component system chemotaxis response regulator CheB
MDCAGAIKVLIVDDQPLTRKFIRLALGADPGLTVAGEAAGGLEAIDKIKALGPDLVTMAMDMPAMGGLDAIEKIMAQCPVPILVVAARIGVRAAFAAISAGALDVLEFPAEAGAPWPLLLKKVRLLARVDIQAHLATLKTRVRPGSAPVPAPGPAPARAGRTLRSGAGLDLVAIAASTGGPQALQVLLAQLPAGFPWPILVAQHMTTGFNREMADWLDRHAALEVREAVHGETLRPGRVYINPPEYSMGVTPEAVVVLEQPGPSLIYHPSCDFLLKSAARAFPGRVVAAILTGMGSDGVAGMRAIQQAGGLTLAQDEATSVVYGMNRQAVEARCIDQVLPLQDLAAELLRLADSALG